MNTTQRSALNTIITRYLEHMRALGRRYDSEQVVLRSLDRFLADTGTMGLTPETFTSWCQTQQHLTSGVLRHRMRTVRKFCLYQQRTEPLCFVPDPDLFPAEHQPQKPYIFTEAEIARVIEATNTLKPRYHSPLHAEVYRLAIVLLYTTGLRRGELIRLTVDDYDPHTQTLLVRESKFHKSRYLPLSPDTARETERYLQARRRRHLTVSAETPLVWRGYGEGFVGQSVRHGLQNLFRIAEIRTPDGRLPRAHDIRHSFAVNALLRWYRNGSDPQAKLPLLSTYLGHVSILSTQHYLHFVDELAAESSARFASHYGVLVRPEPEPAGGGQ